VTLKDKPHIPFKMAVFAKNTNVYMTKVSTF